MKLLLFFIALCSTAQLKTKLVTTRIRESQVKAEVRQLKKSLAYFAVSAAFCGASHYGSKKTQHLYIAPKAFDLATLLFGLKLVYNGILVSSSLLSCCYAVINEKLNDDGTKEQYIKRA